MTTEVLVTVGGFDDRQKWVRDVWCYNPKDSSWHALAPFPGKNRRFAAVAFDNDIYIIAGQVLIHSYQGVNNRLTPHMGNRSYSWIKHEITRLPIRGKYMGGSFLSFPFSPFLSPTLPFFPLYSPFGLGVYPCFYTNM